MTFTLNDSLLNSILSALENQEKAFLLKADDGTLVEKTEQIKADDDIYYSLPEWTSANGFALREDFVKKVYSPLVREELLEVLHSGRGVFRNFRNVLRNYPEVEKKWHIFKTRTMYSYINDWYNSLREVWGLEKLDCIPESDEMLLHDDFIFRDYDSAQDKQEIVQNIHVFFQEADENIPDEIKTALYEMWRNQFEQNESSMFPTGCVCRTLSDDFAGCITASPVTEKEKKVMVITSLFVPELFRGLGIAGELLSMFLLKLKESGKKWVLLPNTALPEFLMPLLLRTGFEQIGTGYIAKLQ